jgi:hypothetical protein
MVAMIAEEAAVAVVVKVEARRCFAMAELVLV